MSPLGIHSGYYSLETGNVPDLTAPIRLDGLSLDMYGGDREHAPRHFHIRKNDDWELVIYYRRSVLEREIIFDVSFPATRRDARWCPLKKKQRKKLLAQLIEHLNVLDTQWELLNPDKLE